MKNLNAKQIAQVREITTQTNTNFHGNTKKVGCLPIDVVREIVAKKAKRDRINCRGIYSACTAVEKSQVRRVKSLIKWSLECKGTSYFKVLIEGNTGIYYASASYGHRDYNKSRIFDKNPQTLKLMHLFNAIISKHA